MLHISHRIPKWYQTWVQNLEKGTLKHVKRDPNQHKKPKMRALAAPTGLETDFGTKKKVPATKGVVNFGVKMIPKSMEKHNKNQCDFGGRFGG